MGIYPNISLDLTGEQLRRTAAGEFDRKPARRCTRGDDEIAEPKWYKLSLEASAAPVGSPAAFPVFLLRDVSSPSSARYDQLAYETW